MPGDEDMVNPGRSVAGPVVRLNRDIFLRHNACPFAEQVLGRPSMCMMTFNVFGSIARVYFGAGAP
jgi:hypothetical protein